MTGIMIGAGLTAAPASGPDGRDPAREARLAEELGFDFVSASDHPGSTSPSFENWTLLSWVAASTSRIKVLSRVLGVPFRSPPMLAKMAETLDRLSGGRLLLGLGAGAMPAEVSAFGPAGMSAGTLTGLEEAIGIIRALWTEPQVSYHGTVHSVSEAAISPRPCRPVPVWLGTFGDRGLAMTGRLADGWIPSLGYLPEDQLPVMRRKVLAGAAAAGRGPADVTCALNLHAGIARQADPDRDKVVGPAGYVADRLGALAAIGFTAFNLIPAGPAPLGQLELLATEVLPQVRALAAA
jgi:alkanesulfonate monooxygenase SsuD/methylene tetrahydromethanopterin reductase-like flavin-dependent oxidoreductase (luciferase family)